ncbi:MAG: CHAD domain-containing protein, partial [Armatimonadetes bacterium]|nr:CHAD domain-containing protein [Armatimonadota bacterium]
DMRVGSRRLVAAMRVFADCFPTPQYRALYREARDVTRALGAVRDLDVLIDHARNPESAAFEGGRLGLDYLIALWTAERAQARKPMLRALNRLERTRFPDRISAYLREEADAYTVGLDQVHLKPPTTSHLPDGGRTPFREAAPPLLLERYQEFYSFEPFVEHPEAETELHDMRIAAKWLRYTMELFAPAYPDGLADTLDAVKGFQELLGDLHDSDVRRDLMDQALSRPLQVEGLLAVGRMLPDPVILGLRLQRAQEQAVRDEVYRSFRRRWRKLAKDGFAARLRGSLSPSGEPPAKDGCRHG